MILHCPGCLVKLRMPDSYLESGKEVWIKCPKCGERFRPQRPNLGGELGIDPASARKGPEPRRRRQVEDILSRIDLEKMGTRRETDMGLILDALPVVPEVPKKTWIFMWITGLMVAALLAALAWVFHSSEAPPPPAMPVQTPPPADYGGDLLISDLMAIRRDLLRLRHVDRIIDYRGSESRIYKYYTPLLAPDLCQDITSLRLWSPRTTEGFTLEAECLKPTDFPATIEIRWNPHTARISVKGRTQTADLPLPRPSPQNTQEGAGPDGQPPDGPATPGGEGGG